MLTRLLGEVGDDEQGPLDDVGDAVDERVQQNNVDEEVVPGDDVNEGSKCT